MASSVEVGRRTAEIAQLVKWRENPNAVPRTYATVVVGGELSIVWYVLLISAAGGGR